MDNLNTEEFIKYFFGEISLKSYKDSKKTISKLDELQYEKSNKKTYLKTLIPYIIQEIYPDHDSDCNEWTVKTCKNYLKNKITEKDLIEILRRNKLKCGCIP